ALRSVTYENVNQNPSGSKTVSFQATDSGGAASNVATRNIDLSGANDAPVVTTSAGSTAYSEGDPATTVDGALTVTDADDTNLMGGQVRLSTGFESGDDLVFVNQNGISGSYDTGTGVLTLTGTASVADYQTALRSIQYQHTGDNPQGTKTVEFKVNDGDVDSNLALKTINITGVNDAPALTTTAAALSYTEGDGAVAIDPGLTAADPDSANFQGATVQITSNFVQADDELAFVDQNGITGAYNDSTGTLTLSGTASRADYQAALRSVTYENSNDNPSGSKTVSFQATDSGGAASNVATRNIDLSGANDAPVVTTSAGDTSYTEGDPATTVDGALTVTDADDTNLEGGQVRISSGFQSGDDLVFVNQNGISGSYNSGTGVLTLAGTASKADYQTALRSIQYRHTGDAPSSSKTVEFKVNDGDADSNLATKGIAITPVNDAPTLTTTAAALSYTEGDGAVAVDSGLTAADPDSANFQGATVQITGNFVQADDELAFTNTANITGVYNDSTGTLTLSGTDTVANYQAALRSVTYESTSNNPSGSKTVSFQATDSGGAASNVATRDINLSGANDAPVVTTSAGSTPYSEGDPATTVDGALTVTDADDTNLEGGQVRISSGFQSGDDLVFVNQNGISGVYNTGTGVLTLTGTASVADYQTALRSIMFQTTNDNPSSPKTVEFKVNDGDVDSNLATKNVAITGANDAPTLTTTAAPLAYTEGDGAVAIDTGLTATDPDSASFQGATVQITSNFVQADDELSFINQNGISGSYDDSTGTLTLSGTASVADYQAALRSVGYTNSSDNPSGSKTVSFQATDSGGAASNVATRNINLTGANDAPVVTTSGGDTAYTEGGAAATVDGALTVTDADDTNLEGGQVRISSGFQSGDDLVFVNQNGISGSYNTGTGVLTLTGTASKADYQTALRSIQFQTTNDNPSSPKTVEFKVNDGDADSNLATKNVVVTGSNDAPTVNTTGAALSYTEGDGAVAVDSGLTVTDPDSTNLSGATVQITGNFVQADDELAFTNQNGISGSYDDSTGTLTLSGTASVANYQTALRSVTYENVNQNPSGSKTVSFQVTDSSSAASNVATRNINLTGANDAPVVTTSAGSTAYTEGDPATTIDGALTVTDADDTNLEGGVVRISSGFQSGDDLVFVNQNGISGVYNTGTGVLTLSGTSSVANYQTALRSIKFQSTNNAPVTSKTVEFKVNDGDVDSNAPTKEIAVTPVNSPPTVDATNAALSYTENDPATAVDSGLTITEPEGDNLSGGSASITANYQAGQDFLAWTDNNLADNITLDNVNSNAQTVVLTGVDTPANYQAALRAVTYQNGSENPSNLTRTVTFSATDTPGGATGSDTRSIAVTPVDDPPDAVNDSATVLEDAAATSIPVLTNDTDIDGGPKTISSATDPANGTVVLTGGSPGAHTGLTYQPDPNYCNDPPGNTPDTFQYTVNGGDSAFVSITVTCVNDAPVADDETFNGANSAVGNTTFVGNDPDDAAPATPDPTDTNPGADRPHKTITGDILAGDTDVDGPGPLTVTPGTFATNDGGSVTIESDGDFTYEPASSTSCTDTSDFFDYTVEDSGSPEQTDTGRVTIAIANCVWYVNNNDAQGNSGTSAAPFDTTQMAETASGAGHFIHVQDGNNTTLGYTTGLNMKANQSLVGEASALVVGGDTLQEADASKRPQLTDALEDVVALDDGNTVTGIEVDPTGANSGIAGASGDTGGGTISNDRIIDTGVAGTAPNLELDSTTGTFSVSDLTVNNTAALGQTSGSTGVRLNSAGTVSFAPTGTISINTTGSKGLDAVSTGLGTSTFDDITVAGSTVGGVRLDTTTGTVGLGDGTGTDLSLTTTSGSEAGLRVNSHTGGGLTVDSAGTDDVHATGGPAVDVTGTSGPTLSFDDVDSTNSGNDGINLDGLGTGTFSATSGDVTGSAGISFDLNGGSGAITYPATFGNGSGTTAIEITGRSGGVVSLSGSISDTNDTGGGVNVASNTGGSTVLSGPTKQFNTTSADAVVFSASDGHTFVLSGGGTDIDTSSGKGLDASTSGTIQVSGSGNTLDSSALSVNNRALNISDTDIAAADVTFQRVSSSGGANGIRLNNTGSAGNLAVTGVGGTCTNADTSGCSGGQIQNTTGTDDSSATPIGTGIVLNNTQDPTLTRVWLHDHSNYGIRGSAVTNFTLANSVINGTNGTNDGGSFEDSSVRFQNASGAALQGSASVTNTHIQGGFTNNFQVTQTAGNLNRITFNSDTIGPNSTTNGNDGIRVQGTGTSTTNVTVLNSALTSARGDLFQLVADGSGGGDLDFESNTVSNNHPAIATGSGGVAINGGAAGPFSLNIHGTNTFRDSLTNALTIQKSLGTGSMTGTIDNADIGLAGTANSGSVEGSGIELTHGGGGTATVSITNNDIRQYNNFGVSLVAGVGIAQSGNFNVTATGNTIANPGNNPSVTGFQGFALNSGVAAGDSFTSCLNLKGNTLAGSAVDAPATDIRVRARQNTTVRLPGYGGSATDTTAVASFLANQNDANPNDPAANPPVPTSSAAKDATSAGFTGTGTTCP
ncbi:MAG TPA: Ig-like domain-containing protein, partial [Thermoleophilaceae bacterium]